MEKTTSPFALQFLAEALALVAERLPAAEFHKPLTRAAEALARGLERFVGTSTSQDLARTLLKVMTPLPPAEAARMLVGFMTRRIDDSTLEDLGKGLRLFVRRLPPGELLPFAESLAVSLRRARKHHGAVGLLEGIPEVAARVTPAQAARVLDEFARPAVEAATDPQALWAWAYWLKGLGPLLPPGEAGRRAGEAMAAICKALPRATGDLGTAYLGAGLNVIAGLLPSREAARVFLALVEGTSDDPDILRHVYTLARALNELATRIGPADLPATAEALTAKVAAGDERKLSAPASGLAALAPALAPPEAARAAAVVTKALEQIKQDAGQAWLAKAVVALAARLPPAEARAALTKAQSGGAGSAAREILARGLAALNQRAKPEEAAADLVAQVKEAKPDTLRVLADRLSEVAPVLTPGQAAEAARCVVRVMEEGPADTNRTYSRALVALAPRIVDTEEGPGLFRRAFAAELAKEQVRDAERENPYYVPALTLADFLPRAERPAAAGKVAALLARHITRSPRNSYCVEELARVTGRLTSREANDLCAPAARAIVAAMPTANVLEIGGLSGSVALLAPRLDTASATEIFTLLRAVQSEKQHWGQEALAPAAGALIARADPSRAVALLDAALSPLEGNAERVRSSGVFSDPAAGLAAGFVALARTTANPGKTAVLVLERRKRSSSPVVRHKLKKALLVLVPRLPREDAVRLLIEAVADCRYSTTQDWDVQEGLVKASEGLPPAPIAEALLKAIRDIPDPPVRYRHPKFDMVDLPDKRNAVFALRSIVSRTTPSEAVGYLTRAMAGTTDVDALQPLAWGLGEICKRLPPADAARHCGEAADVVARALPGTVDSDMVRNFKWIAESLGPHLGRADANRLAGAYLGALNKAEAKNTGPYAGSLAHLGPKLDAETVVRVAHALMRAAAVKPDPGDPSSFTISLADVLGVGPLAKKRRVGAVARAVFASAAGPFAGVGPLQPALEPLDCRLPEAQLARLLEDPACVGHARRVVLDQLGAVRDRHYPDVWAYVRYRDGR